jgi:3-hydroxybutyryl-CoA dehydrogenase
MPAETRSVAVVGAGVMGAEIALVAAQSGFDVVLRDVDRAAIDRGIAHATRTGERQVAKGRASAEDLAAALARIAPAEDDGALGGCAVAIEVVPENLEIKRGVFARLDAALPPGALIASNTSGLSITALGGFTRRPERVVGLHFFNPPSVMRLVEVVRGERTSAETVEEGLALVRAMGKTPVPVAECPGFLVNRVLVRAMVGAYRAAAASGADPAAVDAAVAASGPAPMGPYALGDLIGLDTLASIGADLVAAYGERFSDGGVLAPLVAAGRLGRKSGGGFFDGPPAGDAGAPGPEATAAAAAYYDGARDEARRCRDEGVAAPGDIDVALRLGAGWSAGLLESAA